MIRAAGLSQGASRVGVKVVAVKNMVNTNNRRDDRNIAEARAVRRKTEAKAPAGLPMRIVQVLLHQPIRL
jgi:hypothetical protein